MMAKKTEDRYQSMQNVADELMAYLKTNTKPTKGSPQSQTLSEKFKNRPPITKAITAAACASVLFLAAAITFFFKMDDRTVEVTLNDPSATVTIDGKYHVEFDGKMGHVELDVGPHEVTVTRDGVVIKGWENYEYIVEKEGKNQLEIKVLDQLKPPGKAVTATENDLSSTEKKHPLPPRLLEILKQKPVFVQEFKSRTRPGWDDYGTRIYENGLMVIISSTPKKEVRAWPAADGNGSGLIQADVRTIKGNGWGVVVHSDDLSRGFRLALEKKKLELGPTLWHTPEVSARTESKVLTENAPVNGPGKYDQLHVLIEGRAVTVFLNGEQCGTPVELDFDFGKFKIAPGIISDKNFTKVEFERVLVFPLLDNLDQTFKTTDSRLIKILKQKPSFEQEFETNRVYEKNEKWLREERDGRLILQHLFFGSGRHYWLWSKGKAAPSGLIQVDLRLVKGLGWLQSFHDFNLKYGFHVSMRNGELWIGPDHAFKPHPSTPKYTLLTNQVPTNGLGNWDRLHVLVEGRRITVFLNGQQCGDPVELERALTECTFFPGLIVEDDGSTTRVEYERILRFPLVD